ncbi:MAG: TusE/DsrC/DsvC family sulfur relay protein [Gammaproteobacteria bacterium]|nr:TusE/DsrC/DsvC family sulfur relay protein [Gammaproteobacteria bacterium]
MQNRDYEVVKPGFIFNTNPDFPHAPPDWDRDQAIEVARNLALEMSEGHWEIVRALQEFYASHERIRVRELLDALDERFHFKGGARYLLQMFPGGPLNQGCQIAGLTAPLGNVDKAYGTVR